MLFKESLGSFFVHERDTNRACGFGFRFEAREAFVGRSVGFALPHLVNPAEKLPIFSVQSIKHFSGQCNGFPIGGERSKKCIVLSDFLIIFHAKLLTDLSFLFSSISFVIREKGPEKIHLRLSWACSKNVLKFFE